MSRRVTRPIAPNLRKAGVNRRRKSAIGQTSSGGKGDHMHRMRGLVAQAALILACATALGIQAHAELIRPKAVRAYPDIAADINGVQTYTYNPATQTGTFQVTNTPYLLAQGPSNAGESQIQPNDDGTRQQVVSLRLDRNGRLIDDPANSYALYGTVVLGGQTFSGLLLEGKPTAFGAVAPGAATVGTPGTDVFDLSMKITGGALADRFGKDLYMRIIPKANTFDGQFTRDFSGSAAKSNTRGYHAPSVVPEPTPLVFLLACGAGLALWRRRSRIFKTGLRAPR
jgi:hypothetical protein